MRVPECMVNNCFFQNEPGCTNCKKCTYCGGPLHTSGSKKNFRFDHVRASSIGGVKITPSCHYCNETKNNLGIKTWLRKLKEKDRRHLNEIIEFNLYRKNKIATKIGEIRQELRQ